MHKEGDACLMPSKAAQETALTAHVQLPADRSVQMREAGLLLMVGGVGGVLITLPAQQVTNGTNITKTFEMLDK